MTALARSVRGRWHFDDFEGFDPDDLNLLGDAFLEFGKDRLGSMQYCALTADVDYVVTERGGVRTVEFSWSGSEEGDDVSGRGASELRGETLEGRIYVHRGDSYHFTATKASPP